MPWPIATDYMEAIQHPQLCFADAELKASCVALTALGLPRVMTGNFASVYDLHDSRSRWAVRCFLRDVPGQEIRYTALHQQIRRLRCSFLVGFEYLVRGIQIRGQWYPIVKMEWAQGEAIHLYVERSINDAKSLSDLAANWRTLCNSLHASDVAHGDLQHGNVLVRAKAELTLVDYDSMYVPALRGQQCPELGHENFQHPHRTSHDFDKSLDNFAALVIYTSLRALAIDDSLWSKFHNGENLIFGRSDFLRPSDSPVFRHLMASPDRDVRLLAEHLKKCCGGTVAHVPTLESVARQTSTTFVPRKGETARKPGPVPTPPARHPTPPKIGTASSRRATIGASLAALVAVPVVWWGVGSMPSQTPRPTKRVVGRLPKSREDRALALVISPDGHWLATSQGVANERGEIVVIDTVTGQLRGSPIQTYSEGVTVTKQALAASNDGTRVAFAISDIYGKIEPHLVVYSVSQISGIYRRAVRDALMSVAFSGDDHLIYSSFSIFYSSLLHFLNLRDGRPIIWTVANDSAITSVGCSSDGRIIGIGGAAGNIRLYDIASRSPLFEMNGLGEKILGMELAADGRYVSVGMTNSNVVLIANTKDGKRISLKHDHHILPWTISFSNDSRFLALVEDNRPVVWSLASLNSS